MKTARRFQSVLVDRREGLRLAVAAVELRELQGDLVADDHRLGGQVPTCARLATGLHLERDRPAPDILVLQRAGDSLEDLHLACDLLEDRELSLRRSVDGLDLRLGLLGLAQVRLEHLVPRPGRIAVVALAGPLPLLRHSGLVGELAEFLRVRADHQADDVEGALQIDPVLVIEDHPDAILTVAPIAVEPARRGIHQDAIHVGGSVLERQQRGEAVGAVLFATDHRNSQFADQCMARLVTEHEQEIAAGELHQFPFFLRSQPGNARVVCDQGGRFDYPLPELILGEGLGGRGRKAEPGDQYNKAAVRTTAKACALTAAHGLAPARATGGVTEVRAVHDPASPLEAGGAGPRDWQSRRQYDRAIHGLLRRRIPSISPQAPRSSIRIARCRSLGIDPASLRYPRAAHAIVRQAFGVLTLP